MRKNIGGIMGRLKNWMLYKCFKKEFDMVMEDYNNQLIKKKKRMEEVIAEKTAVLDLVRLALTDNFDVIGEGDNKTGEHVVVAKRIGKSDTFGASIDFFLYGKSYKGISRHPKIMATYKEPINQEPYVHIDDILVMDDNQGNGSILMPYFIEYCKTTKARYINGQLSSVDKDHFDRSIHFYKKHGFEVTLAESGESGSIKYIL